MFVGILYPEVPWVANLLCLVSLVGGVLIVVGFRPGLGAGFVFGGLLPLSFWSVEASQGWDWILLGALPILAGTDSQGRLSRVAWTALLLWLSGIYFCTGVHKWEAGWWARPEVLDLLIAHGPRVRPWLQGIEFGDGGILLSRMVVLWEIGAGVLLLFAPLWVVLQRALALGMMIFHSILAGCFDLGFFQFILVALWFVVFARSIKAGSASKPVMN